MTKTDWLTVGLKLIGVYFAVLGFTVLCIVGIDLVAEAFSEADPYVAMSLDGRVTLLRVLQPVAYIIASCVLIWKTDWCVRKLGVKSNEEHSEPAAPSNRE